MSLERIRLRKDQWRTMLEHVLSCLPEEACGLLGGQNGNILSVLPVKNISENPYRFQMDPGEQIKAMFEIEDLSQPAGTVVQELEKGYVLEDRLLRPSRVGVSKGGPAANGNGNGGDTVEEADEGPPAKGSRVAYEKQSDVQADATGGKGGQFDEEL